MREFSITPRQVLSTKALRRLAVVALFGAVTAYGDVLEFDSRADWNSWAIPPGVLEFGASGDISLSRIDKNIDAVANARDFLHVIKGSRDPIPGGIRVVGS